MSRKRTHAARLKSLVSEDRPQRDIDPEDEGDEQHATDSDASSANLSGDSDDEREEEARARQHYGAVGKSQLRKGEEVALGPEYAGLAVAREMALGDGGGHDPFGGEGSEDDDEDEDDEGDEEESGSGFGSEDEDEDEDGGLEGEQLTDDTEMSEGDEGEEYGEEDEENEDSMSRPRLNGAPTTIDRDELRKRMNEDESNITATIAKATQMDAEKGRAVKKQRTGFDVMLNVRIRLQQGLIAANSMEQDSGSMPKDAIRAAEEAAVNLWNTLNAIRGDIARTRDDPGTKKQSPLRQDIFTNTPTSEIWQKMTSTERASKPYQRGILQKWSNRTSAADMGPASDKFSNTAQKNTILDVVGEQLIGIERLMKKTKMPRSCAPLQAGRGVTEVDSIYDDADFYGIMLKELLEQRSVDSAANVQIETVTQHWRAAREAKTRKNVDTKASKGRKMRYTVHEKLQNYMAPEDRGKWEQRQADELFGGLLGRRLALDEAAAEEEQPQTRRLTEEEALMLFRN